LAARQCEAVLGVLGRSLDQCLGQAEGLPVVLDGLAPSLGRARAVGASHKLYHYREGPVISGLALARGHAYSANLFGADAMLAIGPFSLSLEGAFGSNVDFGPGHRLLGAHAIAGYRIEFPCGLALTPAFMAEVFDPSDEPGHDAVLRLAGGLNLDPARWLRFQLYAEWTHGQMWTYDSEARSGFGGYVFGPVPTRVMLQMNVSL
jgi:hypothetical protein